MLNKKPPVRCSFRASVLIFSAFLIKRPAVRSEPGEEAFRSCSDRALESGIYSRTVLSLTEERGVWYYPAADVIPVELIIRKGLF